MDGSKRERQPSRALRQKQKPPQGEELDVKKSTDRETRIRSAMLAMQTDESLVYTNAVQLFDVKRSTLHDHMSRKCLKFTKGRFPLLSVEEEQSLVKMLANLQARGHVITPYVCRRAAYRYAQLCKYFSTTRVWGTTACPRSKKTSDFPVPERVPNSNPSSFTSNVLGRKWFIAFVRRNNLKINGEVKRSSRW